MIARPLSGFAETFSQYVVEVAPGGGSDRPEDDPDAEAVLFVVGGTVDADHRRRRPRARARAATRSSRRARAGRCATRRPRPPTFHWIRKAYERVDGIEVPEAFVTHEHDVAVEPMPDTDGAWGTQRFVDPLDVRHDMHVNIVSFEPGGAIPFPETHVMEHGLYVLEGKAVYLLNKDWVEVQAGDFMWLRAFCPQACYAGGPGPVPLPALQGRQPAPATAPVRRS